jgi:low temperature requirement protein LtrA
MWRISRAAVPVTGDAHRVTTVEIFFDLVFVFAFTQIISFLVDDLTPIALLQGLILLVLMWWARSAYTWSLIAALLAALAIVELTNVRPREPA